MELFVFLLALVAAVAGDEKDTTTHWLDGVAVSLPNPPPYPDTPEDKTTYYAGLSMKMWILLSIKLVFIVIALVSLIIWCMQKNKKTKYSVHV